MLKISAVYLDKQKSFLPTKNMSHAKGQNSSFSNQQMALC
jgi:hypothetical protein